VVPINDSEDLEWLYFIVFGFGQI